jgi:hypothetical protein
MTGPFDGYSSHASMLNARHARIRSTTPRAYSGRHHVLDNRLVWAPTPDEWHQLYVVDQDKTGHDLGDESRRDDG